MSNDQDTPQCASPSEGEEEGTSSRHENAAGKRMCGLCGNKAPGKKWQCMHVGGYPCPNGRITLQTHPDWICPGFTKKPAKKRSLQPKKKSPSLPEGVKFLYVGAPHGKTKKGVPQHQGVVTVAYSIAEKVNLIEISFAFCSPSDHWCKATGRRFALKRLRDSYLTVPYLYDAKRIVHEVTRAILAHDYKRLEILVGVVTLHVPSWTKALAKKIWAREKMLGRKVILLGLIPRPTSYQIISEMMDDIRNLDKDR